MTLERYREIIPDWERFLAAAARPEPTTIRARTGRIEPAALVDRLEEQGFRLSRVPELPEFFRVDEEPRPVAFTLEHWLGLFYVQRSATGVAAPALAPRPGERVLDLCAAPGGKTTHMADLMGDRGCLVAVEPNEGRIRALAGNVYRTAHVNVLTVAGDGRFLPGGALFDRVLVDAPCSAEGTLRDKGGELRPRPDSFLAYVTKLQEALLRRAVALTAPGGRILYSTCTFAPEENEAVVDAVLRELPVELEPLDLDLPRAPGLTRFGGRTFDPRLALAARIYPHHLDSGGLFLARLRKTGATGEEPAGGPDAGWRAVPAAFPGSGPDEAGARARFAELETALARTWGAAPGALSGIDWLARGDHVWAHGCGEWPIEAWAERGGWRTISVGLRAASFDARGGPRPTNDLIRWLGGAIGRRRVELDPDAWRRLLRREPLQVGAVDDGYVALCLDGLPLGRGFVRSGDVRHEVPKVHARRLAETLERS